MVTATVSPGVESTERVEIKASLFDADDVTYLATNLTPSQLRRELASAQRDAHTDAFFEGTPYADDKPFPNADYAGAVELAISTQQAQRPAPKPIPGRVQLDVDKARNYDIVSLASQYTKLRKSSNARFIGLCPLHDDHSPSFVVFVKDNTWHCFGCNRGGDTIGLVMLAENCDFRTAVSKLGG